MKPEPRLRYPWLCKLTQVQQAAPVDPTPDLTPAVEPVPRLALSAAELAKSLGVSAATVAGWIRFGDGPPSIILPGGRLRRFPIESIKMWLLERQGAKPPADGAAAGLPVADGSEK